MTIETRPTRAEALAPSQPPPPRSSRTPSVTSASSAPRSAPASPASRVAPLSFAAPAASVPGADRARVFVGRERPLGELTGALEQASRGAGSLFLVSGEGGVGKTRLVEEAAVSPEAGGLDVRWGRCREHRQGTVAPHYWPWIQACRRGDSGRASTVTGDATDGTAARAAHQEAARLLRTAAAGSAGAPSGEAAPETGRDRFWLMDTAVELLRQAAAAQPMLLVLDDLQWADDPSLGLLEFLAPELAATPLVVVGIFREPEVLADPGLRSAFGRLARFGRSLPLRGLHAPEIEEIVARRFERALTPAAADHLWTVTGGNPWFVDQVVRLHLTDVDEPTAPGEPGVPGGGTPRRPVMPEAVRSAVRRRLELLPEETRRLLSTAAGIGSEVSLRALAALTGLRERSLLELLALPAACQIVAPDDLCRGLLRFCPPIVADALHDDLGPVQRMELRLRADQALGTPAGPQPTHAPDAAGWADQLVRLTEPDRTGSSSGVADAKRPFAGNVARGAAEPRGEPAPGAGRTSASQQGTAQEGVFRQEGEYWTIAYAGTTVRLKDAKGFRYLAQLLARPLLEVHVADLPLIVGCLTREPGPAAGGGMVPPGLSVRRLGDAGQLLDARAKEAYRRRFEHLQEGLREAQEFNDTERRALIEEEMDALAHELAASVGLRGRDRKAASAAERARVNVTRTIRAAIDKIAQGNPQLGVHLAVSIRTGTFCSYSPDPAARPTWRL